jgi:hypothetical protein
VDFTEMGREGDGSIHLPQDKDRWRVITDTVVDLWFLPPFLDKVSEQTFVEKGCSTLPLDVPVNHHFSHLGHTGFDSRLKFCLGFSIVHRPNEAL